MVGRWLMVALGAVLIMVLALPAEAASKTVTFSNTCKVKIENGSGWLAPSGSSFLNAGSG